MNENIVFVIGAGASKEVNLPTGEELKKTISELLNYYYDDNYDEYRGGDRSILNTLLEFSRDNNRSFNDYLNSALQIKEGLALAISIDNFIDNHRGNDKITFCGKLAIVRAILQAEKNSSLYSDKNKNFNFIPLGKTWYNSFFKLLTENCDINELKERLKTITFIIFNYDRCVEQFLFLAVQNYYGVQESEAAELVSGISVYHPYGQVGELPWLNKGKGIEFGREIWNSTELLELSKKIKTFTEGADPGASEILEIRKTINEASKIVFLGFAFHKLNMQLITPDYSSISPKDYKYDVDKTKVECFATTKGISNSDSKVVEEQIKNLFHKEVVVNLKDLTCAEFFNEYWRSLSF